MTDEQLAGFIRQGGNDELIPLLWERVRKLMHLLSERYFERYKDKLTACGVTSEDIRQSAYMAFVQAIKGFDESKVQRNAATQTIYSGNSHSVLELSMKVYRATCSVIGQAV